MKRMSPKSAAVIALIAFVSAGLSGCSNEKRPEIQSPETISDVPVIVAHKTAVPDLLEAIGTVRATQSSQIASQTMGTIREIRAREGDLVQAGQILATIDDSQPRAAVEQATAAVSAAEKEFSAADSEFALSESTLKRYQQLFDKKSLSPQEFDEIKTRSQSAEARREVARAGVAQANAALTQARTSLGYTLIHAPFAGVVTEKKADAGSLASPGSPLFTVEGTRNYRLEVSVDESDIRKVRTGERVSLSLEALGNAEMSGKVEQIVPTADSGSRNFIVKIGLPADPNLRSGMFGRAYFSLGARQALLIPRTAIIERGQLHGVFAIDANHVAGMRYVMLGKLIGQQMEVLSGLQDGETIVAAAGTRELAGKQITVTK